MASLRVEPQEAHVSRAACFLAKLSSANRPKTVSKLSATLLRKGCCRLRIDGCPPPGRLAQAMLAPLEAGSAPKELTQLAATFAEADQLLQAQAPSNEVPKEWLEAVGKAAAETLLNAPLADFVGKPVDVFAKFLCGKAFVMLSTDPELLVSELERRGLVLMDPTNCVQYEEAKLKGLKPRLDSNEKPDTEAWLSSLLLAEAPRAVLRKAFAPSLGESLGLPYSFVGCTSYPISVKEIHAFRSKFECAIDYNRKAEIMKIRRTTNTAPNMDAIQAVLAFAFGKAPAFVCKGISGAKVLPHVIGKDGRFVKKLESAHSVTLSTMEMESVQRSSAMDEDASTDCGGHLVCRLVGWLGVTHLPNSSSLGDIGEVSDRLRQIAQGLRDKVSNDIEVHLGTISEKAASIKHGSSSPSLRRTFSSEYTQMKSDRERHFGLVQQRKERRKEHLAAKDQRLHTKRGRRKEKDKGPSMHGGRHKVGEAGAED